MRTYKHIVMVNNKVVDINYLNELEYNKEIIELNECTEYNKKIEGVCYHNTNNNVKETFLLLTIV